ncbi:MAG: flippase-like domain-containing protein [Anaerolineaceae bacterium]|nr:flippase-like domain-containing protein [Anaerolineaceae bacterium]
MGNNFINNLSLVREKHGRQILAILKLLILVILSIFAFMNFDSKLFFNSIHALPFQNILYYLSFIFLSKLLYAFRWKINGKVVFPKVKISLFEYFQYNVLAEFISIVMPTSIGGEITRILKIRQKNVKTSYATASILIDRALGIIGMALVSICALLLLGKRMTFSLKNILPDTLLLPIILGILVIFVIVMFLFLHWVRQPRQTKRLSRAWDIIRDKFGIILISLGISIVGHLVFSLAHSFLFVELYPLSWLETIAIILTPQLARSIPISVLGISAGEGLMVASQMMAGMPRETALIITIISLFGRYFFAFLGFLLEFLKDGVSFFKQVKENKHEILEDEADR